MKNYNYLLSIFIILFLLYSNRTFAMNTQHKMHSIRGKGFLNEASLAKLTEFCNSTIGIEEISSKKLKWSFTDSSGKLKIIINSKKKFYRIKLNYLKNEDENGFNYQTIYKELNKIITSGT